MSAFSTLDAVALRVDELLRRPGAMATARSLVAAYLAGRVQDAVEAIPFPMDQAELDGGPDANYALATPTPEQTAAALAALHDTRCSGVEKVTIIPAELPAPALGEAIPTDAEAQVQLLDWRRVVAWRATLDRVRGLGESALQWFGLQVPRFEESLPSVAAPPAGAPTDPFANFSGKQRVLLLSLWGKGKVPIQRVLSELYGTEPDEKLEALQQLVKRTNRKLAEEELHSEVGRKGEYLELRDI